MTVYLIGKCDSTYSPFLFLSCYLSYYRRSKENEEKLYFSEVEEEERDEDLPSDKKFQPLDTVVDHIIRVQEKKDGDIPCSLAYENCLQELAVMQVPAACRLCQSPVSTAAEVTRVGTATYLKWVSLVTKLLSRQSPTRRSLRGD